ncbi:hypothetical protein Cni_G06662 [Canna indica]|uniref:Uncharacterized protein n=1 Tax=Canna indica TaxID=4628 RepID=A0AAQ3JX11_9LILI|nr:hypothetical protein Cni_G06662 [Canna indica]
MEISLEREGLGEDDPDRWWRYPWSELVEIRVGASVIETTVAYDDNTASEWIRHVQLHNLKRRGPLVASICFFHGTNDYWRFTQKDPKTRSSNPSNPICAIALCVDESHCLIFHNAPDYRESVHTPKVKLLSKFLEDKKVHVVGINACAEAERLEKEWRVRVAHAIDLGHLVERAFRTKAWEMRKRGKEVVRTGIGMEEMAALALDGMRVEKKPPKLMSPENCTWGVDHKWISDIMLMYAVRDAFLGFLIGLKSLKKIGFSS